MDPAQDLRTFRFGLFELDLQGRELRKNGVRLKLHDQPFRVLTALVERPGDVISREALRSMLWPDGTFVDYEHSINSAINRLRDALGDTAGSAKYIETVPRRGYRFVAPVEMTVRAEAVTAIAPASTVGPDSVGIETAAWSNRILLVASVAVLVVYATIVLVRPGAPREPGIPVPLTTMPGYEAFPTFSPDGDRIAFCWGKSLDRDGDIYVKQIGSEQLLRLTSNPAWEGHPAWSPDGRTIAFVRVNSPSTASIVTVPALGGQERTIGEFRYKIMTGLSWSPDGRWLAISEGQIDNAVRSDITAVSVETGEHRRLTTVPMDAHADLSPAFSPDGKKLAFVRALSPLQRSLMVMELATDLRPAAEPVAITTRQNVEMPAWTGDGDLVFTSGPPGTLWRVRARAGSTAKRMPFVGNHCTMAAVAPTKARLAYACVTSDINIWRMRIVPATREASEPAPWISSTHRDDMPRYSPDGKRIAFVSGRSGTHEVWVAGADGSNPVQLTSSGENESTWPEWSPDGEFIAFVSHVAGQSRTMIMRSSGGAAWRLSPAADGAATWSRDGKWINFVQNSGSRRIARVAVRDGRATGPEVQVVQGDSTAAVEALGGRAIYYAKGPWSATSIFRSGWTGDPATELLRRVTTPANFAVAAEGIYYTASIKPGKTEFRYFDVKRGTDRLLSTTDAWVAWGLTVSPDETSLLFSRVDQYGADLKLIENFR
jgi:Tol biopolymer transport system component